ncbi:MAG: zinc ribbon domain-containing protein [Chloroflexota bacterium]|nr:zinc ribbon domain-containing protein [Chloroflexota bacterium]
MKCSHCNATIEPDARSCRHCGTPGAPIARPLLEARTLFATEKPPEQPRRRERRGGGGFARGCLVFVVILLVLGVLGWVFALRPYLNNIAKTQLDQSLASAVQQIDPARTAQLPQGPVSISDTLLNNLLTLTHAPSSPIQNTQMTITASVMTLTFTLYGSACTITGVPQSNNGQLVMTNMQISGLLSWIMSNDDLTQIVNKNLATAQQRLRHSITSVLLKDHEVDLVIGAATSSLRRPVAA